MKHYESENAFEKKLRGIAKVTTKQNSEKLIVLMRVAIALLFVSITSEVRANCICRCVNGNMQAICSSSIDIQPICPPTICQIVPPSIAPIQSPTIPPIGTTNCAPQQVLNPYTHVYEWKSICQ